MLLLCHYFSIERRKHDGLAELKIYLELSEDDVSDEKLQINLDDAIDEVQRMCKQDFIVDGTLKLPPTVKKLLLNWWGMNCLALMALKKKHMVILHSLIYPLKN